MSDSEEKPESSSTAASIPSWQKQSDTTEKPADEETSSTNGQTADAPSGDDTDKLEVARRFLSDEKVKDAPRQQKVEFLTNKGIDPEDIELLLGPDDQQVAATTTTNSQPADDVQTRSSSAAEETTTITTSRDRPPIVTYPEFLAKPARPPPLVTTNRLLNTLYAFTGLSALLYGTSRFVVDPMLETQAEARHDYYETTAQRLDALIAKLEGCVSEIPTAAAGAKQAAATTADEDAEDPAEMFHRDMGTQTSFPASPVPLSPRTTAADEPATKRQSMTMARLNRELAQLRDDVRAESEDMDNLKAFIATSRDDIDALGYVKNYSYMPYTTFSQPKRTEPDDEIRKTRDNIRRLKGVLMSTRNFPTTAR